jgi:hypothetical protein
VGWAGAQSRGEWNIVYVVNRAPVSGTPAVGDLTTYSVDVRGRPVFLAKTETVGEAGDLAVVANVAYVVDSQAGLLMIDVSNPAQPKRLGTYRTDGAAAAVTVVGHVAYVAESLAQGADSLGEVELLDVGDPAHPVRLGSCRTRWLPTHVVPAGNLAYVAEGAAGLEVLDVSNPAQPVRLGGNSVFRPGRLVVANGRLYGGGGGLSIADLVLEARFRSIQTVKGKHLRLGLQGTPGAVLRVQRSPDLRRWDDWMSIVLGDTPSFLADTPTNAPQQFYRARFGP